MKYARLLIPVCIISFLFLSIGNSLLAVTDPVESNYALTAKEMVLSGDWLSPRIYNTFWFDKPVFTYWALCVSYALFGFSDFASRLPFTLCGALSVTMLAYYVKRRGNETATAILAATMTATSLLFWVITRSVLTDQFLFLFTEISLFSLYIGLSENNRRHIYIAYAAAAGSVLTKGPVGIVLPGLIILVYIACERKTAYLKRLFRPDGPFLFLFLCLPWYVYMHITHGQAFWDGLLGFNNVTRAVISEHPEENVWYYYLLVVPVGLLPWTGVALYGIKKAFRRTGFPLFATLWAGITVLFYTLLATKYPTYAYIAHIPLMWFAAVGAVYIYKSNRRIIQFIAVGPAFFFWILFFGSALFVRVDYLHLGSLWPLIVFIPTAILIISIALYKRAYLAISPLIAMATAAIYVLLTWQVLVPFYEYRSTIPLVTASRNLKGHIYFFEEYRTSFEYYTGRSAVLIAPAEYDESARLKRDSVWSRKHLFKTEESHSFSSRLHAGENLTLIVPKSRTADFEKSEFKDLMTLQGVYGTFFVYTPREEIL